MRFKNSLPLVVQAGKSHINPSTCSRICKRHFASKNIATKNGDATEYEPKPREVILNRSTFIKAAENSPWISGQQSEARHLLRAILREATYLPDPHASTYMTSHALSRFRDYTPPSKPMQTLQERRDDQVKLARKALSELRRGNAGELKVLAKILHLTYGRIGKRRHELLQPLLIPDNGSHADQSVSAKGVEQQARDDAAASWPTMAATKHPDMVKTPLPQLTNKLKALLVSQVRTQPPEITRANPRALTPKIPEKNAWERPMPWKRVKNMTHKWYATVLDRTLPPLGTAMWDDLRKRALGQISYKPPRSRRARAPSSSTEKDAGKEALEKQLGLYNAKSLENVLKGADERAKGRNLTTRFMQRRWAAVFAQCAKMEWDNKNGMWNVTWGSEVLNQDLRKATAPPTTHD
ncbi:hypothetical protein BDV97DRAFT_401714 [Delphinella strobiligena]|nr:hypothetical protein BDV97DRAFT_401714 [Delphinella strobiligena]